MRLPPQPGERLDRDQELSFLYEGFPVRACEGDTIGSALYAFGQRVFSRSFKYHRPRGLLCCSGHCPNCMMEVDGVPNVRVCVEPVRAGASVKPQNVVGSLDRDVLALTDKLGGPFTPVGFYYRTMIRPRAAWPYFERFLRNVAGLGRIDKHAKRTQRYDIEHRRTDVLVVGGGQAGLEAARKSAADGHETVLVDEGLSLDPAAAAELPFTVHAPARALGVWEGRLVPIDAGNVLYRYRTQRLIVAAGATEQPLLFPGNDLVGVMLPQAIRRLVRDFAIRPGERACVVSADDRGLEAVEALRTAGVDVVETLDLRERRPRELVASGSKGRVKSFSVDGAETECDLVVASGVVQPNYSLVSQAGGTVEYDQAMGIFRPVDHPDWVEVIGGATGELGPTTVPQASFNGASGKGKCFVCICEDVTDKDIKRAIAEGFDSIELAKRYTTVTMGPCQGKLCQLNAIRLYARENETDEQSIGTTTARPPWAPVTLGLLAGRGHEPAKRTSMHHRHKDSGATMMWTGEWRRPYAYGDPEGEAKAVHESLGLIDVSTLGKLLVRGRDAGEFLDRLYPNRFSDLKVGRIRYGVLQSDAGRIMDDGTIARLDDETFYVTTTSTGAGTVLQWFGWWNAVWQLDVEIKEITGALCAVNVAGPNARLLLERLTELDVSADGFTYLDAKQASVAGVNSLILRIGFVGELGYEIHCPSPYGVHLWDTLLEAGADWGIRPFGLEPQRILRLEKMHILPGQDTDSESDVLSAAMPWIVKWDKDDFVGRWSLEDFQERGSRERLVGFVMENGVVPEEGGQIVIDGKPAGRVTSARLSPELGKAIGLGWVPPELADEDTELQIRVQGNIERGRVKLRPFFDPDGERLRS